MIHDFDYNRVLATFRRCSNNSTRQNDCIEALADHIDALFPHQSAIRVVELGCGRGDKALALQKALKAKGKKLIYTGYDMDETMLAVAQKRIPKGKFLKHDIFAPMQVAETDKADIVLGMHTAYYGYDKQTAERNDLTKLERYAANLKAFMRHHSIALLMHQSEKESTNEFKLTYSDLIESNATKALGPVLQQAGLRREIMEFRDGIHVPHFTPENIPQDVADLVTFITHKNFDGLPDESKAPMVRDFHTLCEKHGFHLPTYTEFSIATDDQCPLRLKLAVRDTMRSVQQKLHPNNRPFP